MFIEIQSKGVLRWIYADLSTKKLAVSSKTKWTLFAGSTAECMATLDTFPPNCIGHTSLVPTVCACVYLHGLACDVNIYYERSAIAMELATRVRT